jgi:FkbM family methyltransferase
MKLLKIGDTKIWYRPETESDKQAIDEVLVRRAYRRVRSGFDVEPGERWLDLGANIGAFAVYCRSRAATAVCFEPEPGCFRVLTKNAGLGFTCFQQAVTASKEPTLRFVKSANPLNHYRGTTLDVQGYVELPPVANFFAGDLAKLSAHSTGGGEFSGIKMDIEGAEGPILDAWLLPRTKKLVMEYHTSRDSSVQHLKARLNQLKRRFEHVLYPSAYDKAIASGAETFRPRFDQLIFAWSPK